MGETIVLILTLNEQKEPLPTTFPCLFCNHENSVLVKLDKKAGTGELSCKVCGQQFQTGINCKLMLQFRESRGYFAFFGAGSMTKEVSCRSIRRGGRLFRVGWCLRCRRQGYSRSCRRRWRDHFILRLGSRKWSTEFWNATRSTLGGSCRGRGRWSRRLPIGQMTRPEACYVNCINCMRSCFRWCGQKGFATALISGAPLILRRTYLKVFRR